MGSLSSRVPPKVSWNDPLKSLSKDSGPKTQLYKKTNLLCSFDITIFTASRSRGLGIEHLKSEFVEWALNVSLESQLLQLKENQSEKPAISENYRKQILKYSEDLRKKN